MSWFKNTKTNNKTENGGKERQCLQ